MPDMIYNGQAMGDVAQALLGTGFDAGALRPYLDSKKRPCITINQNGKPTKLICNAPATLRRDEWKVFDDAVIRSARPQMRAWADLRAANTYTIPNGMGKTILEYQTMGDITPATISMDGLRISEYDRPMFDVGNLPLPIIHKDLQYPLRQIMLSRNGDTPLDTTSVELATRRVAEEVEKLTLGIGDPYSYGGASVFGYMNFPDRITKDDITDPTSETTPGWHPRILLREIAEMKQLSQESYFYGPWVLYFSPAWDIYLDDDYHGEGANYSDISLRQRIAMIDGISAIRTLQFLQGFHIIMVQMTSDVARAVVGMDIRMVQWSTQAGFQVNFKVLCIMVPQLRTDYNGHTGIVHGYVGEG